MKRDDVRSTFDDYSKSYSQSVDDAIAVPGAKGSYFIKVKADYLIEAAQEEPVDLEQLSVLDLGCGTGSFHPFIKTKFGSVKGVDISSDSIEQARNEHPDIEYSVYDGQSLPYANGSFDVAFASCVFHHIPLDERAAVLRETRRVLKKGGRFIVFEHNTVNPLTRKTIADCPFDDDAIMINPQELEALFAEAGFESVGTQVILSVPPVGRWGRKIDKLLGKMGIGAQYFVSGRAA